MATKIVMPQLGESVVEGTISKWLVTEGDSVQQFDPILEVTTDKIDTELTASAAGILLKILVVEGTTVQVGTLLAWIGDPDEQLPESAEIDAPAEPLPKEASNPLAVYSSAPLDSGLGFVSPVVSKLANEYGLDLGLIKGTGRDGRVTKKDVLNFVAKRTASPQILTDTSGDRDLIHQDKLEHEAEAQSSKGSGGIELTRIRRAIAEHMVRSKSTSAHVTTVFEADMSRVVAHREVHKGEFAREDVNLTFTPYFIVANAAALAVRPIVNSSLLNDRIILRKDINIGVAVSLGEDGLIVPVIRDAGDKSLLVIANELNDLARRARENELKLAEVQDGTFTITNHGMSGSLMSTPIINQPQCAIMGVGVIQPRAMVIKDTVAIRPMVYLTLSFDHRIIDGAIADDFLAKVKEVLEEWS